MGVDKQPEEDASGTPKKWWIAGLVIGALILFSAWVLLPVDAWVKTIQAWFAEQGASGAALFLLLYIAAVVLLLPGSALSIAAGLLYGFWGLPLAVAGATVGASLAFLLARYAAHEKLASFLQNRPRIHAVVEAVNEGGWKVVGLVRLSPVIPFNLQNYFFGLTRIPFMHYAVSTCIGIVPGTAVNIYLGAMGDMVLNEASRSQVRWGFFMVGLIVTAIVTWFITRKAREKLAQSGVSLSGKASSEEEAAPDQQ